MIVRAVKGPGSSSLFGTTLILVGVMFHHMAWAGAFLGAPTQVIGTKGATCVVAPDINGDGKHDVVATLSAGGTTSLAIATGIGSGTFNQPTAIPFSCAAPTDLSAVDFDLDGKGDIVVVCSGSSQLVLFRGDGAGGFVLTRQISTQPAPFRIGAGNLYGDAKPEIAIAHRATNLLSSVPLTGVGSTWQATGPTPVAVALADANKDGKVDLISVGNDQQVAVRLGTGGATNPFVSMPISSPLGGIPTDLATGDFNADGNIDVAVTIAPPTRGVRVMYGTGNGLFGGSNLFPAAGEPRAIVASEMGAGGHIDLAVASFNPASLMVFVGGPGGIFTPTVSQGSGGFSSCVDAADFNGDGIGDVVAADGWVQVALGSASGVVAPVAQTISFPPLPSMTFGDADFPLGASASSGLSVSYASNDTSVATIVNGNRLHVVGAGVALITATQSGNTGYLPATPVTMTLTVNKAQAQVTLLNLLQVYSVGSPRIVNAVTCPANLNVIVTYSGSVAAPTAIGKYPIIATVHSANYQGTASGVLTVIGGTPVD